jgi:hypothetical protein
MQHILLAIGILITTTCHAQEVELLGKYSAGFLGAETIEFVGKDSFYFHGFYCTDGVHGKGRCEIRNNQLYLYFEKSKKKTGKDTVRPAIITRSETADGSTRIEITSFDYNHVPIPNTSLYLERKDKATLGAVANDSGRASFTLMNNIQPISIKLSNIGFKLAEINIQPTGRYSIKVFLENNDLPYKPLINGEVYVYDIEELSEELIVMKPQGSSERFRKYRKQKE